MMGQPRHRPRRSIRTRRARWLFRFSIDNPNSMRQTLLFLILVLLEAHGKAQTWSSLGGPLNDGRIASIAVDPSDESHWLAGAGNGGVWETRDAGTNWLPLSDAWPTLAIGAVTFAPSDPKIIYVGTGEPDSTGFEHAGLGLMKSTDGGKTWTLLAASSFAGGSVKRIRVHPANPNILTAATVRGGAGRDSLLRTPSPAPLGILRSTDGGLT